VSDNATVPLITFFFLDSLIYESAETERNLTQFHDWVMNRKALQTNNLQAVELRYKIETETVTRAFLQYQDSGPPQNHDRYAVYEDRKRLKVTPYNRDPVRYSEWIVTRHWEEPAGHQTIKIQFIPHEVEIKEVVHHGPLSIIWFSSRDHTHYSRNVHASSNYPM
jgi:hypothetical protein